MMLLPASNHILPAADDETSDQFPDSELKIMVERENLQQERQISVDPISLRESASKVTGMSLLVPPPPYVKTKFLSTSVPNSTASSPLFSSSSVLKKKKKWKNDGQPSALPINGPLSRQHSVALDHLHQLRESHLQRSKSCGEGRATAPSDDFDLVLFHNNVDEHGHIKQRISSFRRRTSTEEAAKSTGDQVMHSKIGEQGMDSNSNCNEKFKCGAFCLFLPGFSKGKPVRPRKEEHVISRTVSLEKFECGSWTSSAIIMDNNGEDGDSTNLFFDLPLELIRSNVNDSDSPVTAAFVFNDRDRRGVLRTSSSSLRATSTMARVTNNSSRHVRFSTSSPISHPTSPTSCITPRLRKAREDFNAFLEAQSA